MLQTWMFGQTHLFLLLAFCRPLFLEQGEGFLNWTRPDLHARSSLLHTDLNAASLDIWSHLQFGVLCLGFMKLQYSEVVWVEFSRLKKIKPCLFVSEFFDISVCFYHKYSPFLFRLSMIHWSLIRLKRLFSHNSRKCCRSLKFKSLWESEIGGAAIFSEDTVHGSSWYQSAILVLFIPVIL